MQCHFVKISFFPPPPPPTPHPPISINPNIKNALVLHSDEIDLTTTKWKFETGKNMKESSLL
jgi:hypothetical protein